MNHNILNKVVVFTLDGIHLTTGKKTMTPDELRGINSDSIVLPPEKIASLGSKQIIDPKQINRLRGYRTTAYALYAKYGVPFLSGYAVPSTLADELRNHLNDLKNDFYSFKTDFIDMISDNFLAWLDIKDDDEHSEVVKKLFESECIDIKRLEEKLQFGFSSFNIAPYGEGEEEEKTNSLKDAVLMDVAEKAYEIINRGTYNSNNVSQSTLNVIRDMQTKLLSLAVLSEDVQKLSDYLDNFLNALPSKKPLDQNDSFKVTTLIVALSDTKTLKQLVNATNVNEQTVSRALCNDSDQSDFSSLPSGNIITDGSFIIVADEEDEDINQQSTTDSSSNDNLVPVPENSDDSVVVPESTAVNDDEAAAIEASLYF